MAKLSYKQRNKLPKSDFAVKGRKYPIEDKAHARNALARVSQHGSSAEKSEVRRAVARKYPGIGAKKGSEKPGAKRSKKPTKRYGK